MRAGSEQLKEDRSGQCALILADDRIGPEDFAAQPAASPSSVIRPARARSWSTIRKWRLPQRAWRERLIRAADDYDSNAMLELAITVDARPIAGNAGLFEPVAEQIHSLGRRADALSAHRR
ncbi:MAG: hypothetical protein R3F18_06760 [Lysobacterales bacterium]